MKRKILSFISSNNKLLALFSKPHPEHGGGGWFVVTGGVEGNETLDNAVKREIKEETNLDAREVFELNWGSIYEWAGEDCEESNFISFVDNGDIKLNEEHSEFRWLDLDEFVILINWGDDKKLLKKVLKSALKKRLYFKKLNTIDYRKKD
jgi:8-oxo-dGTP pyrophosphatase MutT (NUDIX family)